MVFVDNMDVQYGRMIMSHMVADTTNELLDMAKKIGVNKKWLQHAGTYKEHFDICKTKKKLAIQNGAVLMTTRDMVKLQLLKKRNRDA